RLDGQHLRRTPTDLTAVCESVAARYATARVPVRAETAGPCVVEGDADALARLLVNLLDNAVRHAASRVCVSVRLDDARSRAGEEGAGLGLAIVKSTAEAHGGSVSLADARPGLRATVRLPQAGAAG